MEIKKKIEDLKKSIKESQTELKLIDALQKAFKKLEIHVDRWGIERYSTPEVNNDATKLHFTFSCGCCADASFLVYIFAEINGVKIFTKPDYFAIGEKNSWGTGVIPDEDWKEKLKEHNINDKVIEATEKYLKNNPPIDYNDDLDDLEEMW